MKSIGVDLKKGAILLCCLEGTFENPVLVEKCKRIINPETPLPEYMDKFESEFNAFINKHSPDRIGYRLVIPDTKEKVHTLSFPYGILNLIAKKTGIQIREFVHQNFVATKFGLSKGLDLYEHCDAVFGSTPPSRNKAQKNAILSAWLSMKD